jgi:hypothetical protein
MGERMDQVPINQERLFDGIIANGQQCPASMLPGALSGR